MGLLVDFAYGQARLQARHGRLPDDSTWQALVSSRTMAHYLAQARSGPLAEWADELGDGSNAHQIERQLRRRWHRLVDEVARWQPVRWRAATRWFATLTDLPLIDGAMREGPSLPWLQDDERLNGLARPGLTGSAHIQPGPTPPRLGGPEGPSASAELAPFMVRGADGRLPRAASVWLDRWQRLVPPSGADVRLARRPAELLLPRLMDADGARAADDAATRHALQRLFRRHAGTAVAVFAHLARVVLDIERLRGGLVTRCVTPPDPTTTDGTRVP